MIRWNFGTLAQRAHWNNWVTIFRRILRYQVVASLWFTILSALVALPWLKRRQRLFAIASFALW